MTFGRPTDFTDDLSDAICSRIAGGESMRSISRDDEMPAMTTLFRWLREKDTFRQQYELAKEESGELYADDIVDVADNQVGNPLLKDGEPVMKDGKPVMVVDAASVAHAKLRVDARKWTASKLKPKKYGDSTNVNLTKSYKDLDDDELMARLKQLGKELEQSVDD